MIEILNQKTKKSAHKIFNVFQKSYAIEAKILKADDFPPLKRTIDQLTQSENMFLGNVINKYLTAVIELNIQIDSIHIQSLVVHPNYFKQGIAIKLLEYVFEHYNTPLFKVETGADNLPAINLYKKLGFEEVDQFDTNHGIRKIRLKKT